MISLTSLRFMLMMTTSREWKQGFIVMYVKTESWDFIHISDKVKSILTKKKAN